MSVTCGVECVVCIGCSHWAWKRCTYVGSDDSVTWITATPDEFEPVPRICRAILAVYEPDLAHPKCMPNGGYRMNPSWLVKRIEYEEIQGQCPPYIIYVDHDHQEIILAVRGLNLRKESDYEVLLDNRLGMQMLGGGYVHHGLLKAAVWLLNREADTIRKLWLENGSTYRIVFAGHSLGSGVAALMTVIVVNHRDKIGGVPREKIRCYAVAPARCMSLNLAVKYADVIHSIVLQDDFLPRTPTPLEDIFRSIFCLPCLLFWVCMRDTFIPEDRKLGDPRRLYAPGRIYHIVERKFCRCGRFPPEVRTAIPVDGRFEHIVLSCNATSDHAIIWIEREAEKALERMRESMDAMTPPPEQRFTRLETLKKEHKNALERAVSLNVPHAATTADETAEDRVTDNHAVTTTEETAEDRVTDNHAVTTTDETAEDRVMDAQLPHQEAGPSHSRSKSSGKTNWEELVEKLFNRDESGKLVLTRDRDLRK